MTGWSGSLPRMVDMPYPDGLPTLLAMVLLVEAAGVAAIVAIGMYLIRPVRPRLPSRQEVATTRPNDAAQWIRGQAEHIRAGRWSAVDRDNVANMLLTVTELVKAAKEAPR